MVDNSITWERFPGNPVIRPEAGTWRSQAAMTADIIDSGDKLLCFYTGKDAGKDAIGIAEAHAAGFGGTQWRDRSNNPVVSPGIAGSFDCDDVVDPAVLRMSDGRLFLYYSALGNGPDSIGLAVSENGGGFEKMESPVLEGRAPEVVVHDGRVYLFYSRENSRGGYSYHCAVSSNGYDFTQSWTVFEPAGEGWDSKSVVTARILRDNGIYIMTYAGDHESKDYPAGFGHAFSADLVNWIRFGGNPVFLRGEEGQWDSTAVWFPEVIRHGDVYYLYYEGYDGQQSSVGMAVTESPLGEIGRRLLEKNG